MDGAITQLLRGAGLKCSDDGGESASSTSGTSEATRGPEAPEPSFEQAMFWNTQGGGSTVVPVPVTLPCR